MPRPRMNDTDVENNVDSDPNIVNAGAETAGIDATAVNANGAEDKKLRGGKRLKVADGTLGLLPEPVKADVPKRGGGRGRTVSPQTL